MGNVCNVCGAKFSAAYPWVNKCSDECRMEMHRRKTRERQRENRKRNPRPKNMQPCVICASVFHATKTKKTCSKACEKVATRRRHLAWSKENAERTRAVRNEQQKVRYQKRKSSKQRYAREWYESNRARILKAISDRREADPERFREKGRRLYRADPVKERAKAANARAKRKAAPGKHSAADVKAIVAAQNNKCAYCKANLARKVRHMDHIIPIAKGGSNDRKNLQALCRKCNHKKSAKDPIDFAQSIGLLL